MADLQSPQAATPLLDRAACSGSEASEALPCTGLVSSRPTTCSPAAAIAFSSSARLRRPRCSARSDRTSQPSPPGSRCAAKPSKSPAACRCPRQYTACSTGALGRAGNHGGLQTMKRPAPLCGRNKLVCSSSTFTCRRCKFSCAQASARGSRSVATIGRLHGGPARPPARRCPCRCQTPQGRSPLGRACCTRLTYSPRCGENTP